MPVHAGKAEMEDLWPATPAESVSFRLREVLGKVGVHGLDGGLVTFLSK